MNSNAIMYPCTQTIYDLRKIFQARCIYNTQVECKFWRAVIRFGFMRITDTYRSSGAKNLGGLKI